MVRMERRPTTATLLKPAVLDTRLLGIFDMTTVSREHLLAIKNLVHSTPRCNCKCTSMSKMETFAMDYETAKMNGGNANIQKVRRALNKTYRVCRHNAKSKLSKESASDTERGVPKIPVIPVPCITCGRQDQPERFHSHPTNREVKTKEAVRPNKETEKRKTVQKPVAIKFRSAKTKLNDSKEMIKSDDKRVPLLHLKLKEQKSPKRTHITTHPEEEKAKIKAKWKEAVKKTQQSKLDYLKKVETSRFLRTPSYEAYRLDTWTPAPVSGGRKRKVVCYICSQEFGTAALPSHEKQCIQVHLNECNNDGSVKNGADIDNQNKIPLSEPRENWNLAFELTQTALVACKCCGRKFLPNRVDAHEKICFLASNKHHDSRGHMKDINPSEINLLNNTKEFDEIMDDSEIFWKVHQAQLVPCKKCARTFYPDRLEVHVKGCKGLNRHKTKPTKTIVT